MAVPSLAAMAGLTLFHMQQEWREGMTKGGVTPKMSLAQPPFNSDTHVYASRIQRRWRHRHGAIIRIAAAMRGFLTRVNTYLGRLRPLTSAVRLPRPLYIRPQLPQRIGTTRLLGEMRLGPEGPHLARRFEINRVRRNYSLL